MNFHIGHLWWYGRQSPASLFGENIHLGFSHGILVARTGVEPSEYWLRFVNGGRRQYLLSWGDFDPFKHVVISSPDDLSNIFPVMVLTGIQKPAFAICDNIGGRWAWFKQDSTLVEPHSSNHQLLQFTNAIRFEGKFYALSLQGTLVVIEKIDSHFIITSLGTKRAIPTVQFVRFKEYLIESNGEILLVFLIFMKSIQKVEKIEVYNLKFDRLLWVKMESIGDRTFFLGSNCSMTVINANKIGCSVNCIYFSYETPDGWWVYDMERESITPAQENCFVLQNPPMCVG